MSTTVRSMGRGGWERLRKCQALLSGQDNMCSAPPMPAEVSAPCCVFSTTSRLNPPEVLG